MSIGVRTHGERPMTPYKVALSIQELINETGDDLKKIGNRLKVTPDTCKMFLAILDMPPDWWDILRFGTADGSGRLPFSMASKVAPKFKKGEIIEDDLDLLKGAAVHPTTPALRDDINNIISCYSTNPDKSIQDCIKEIMNLVPDKISSFIIITDIDPKFVEKIKKTDDTNVNQLLIKILSKYFPEKSIENIRIKNEIFIQLFLNEVGHKSFYALAEKKGLLPKEVINDLLDEEISNG